MFPASILRARAIRIIAAGTTLVGLADYLTGQDVWFGPFYLLVIGLASWTLGWREGLALAFTCILLVFTLNGSQLYPYNSAAELWNLAVRIIVILMVICLMEVASRHYSREWWRARTDPLTGALNRQAFYELVGLECHSKKWTLLAYADLDGLKRLNDQQGHAKGDHCLKEFASGVKKAIRKGDVFARIGGDEFLVHMMIKDEASGKAVSKRLHRSMNAVVANLAPNLRCSVGTIIIPPGMNDIERHIEIADKLMYEAKQDGASLRVATRHETSKGGQLTRHKDCDISFVEDVHNTSEATNSGPLPIALRIAKLNTQLSQREASCESEAEPKAAA